MGNPVSKKKKQQTAATDSKQSVPYFNALFVIVNIRIKNKVAIGL